MTANAAQWREVMATELDAREGVWPARPGDTFRRAGVSQGEVAWLTDATSFAGRSSFDGKQDSFVDAQDICDAASAVEPAAAGRH